jgi:hypothetical protein
MNAKVTATLADIDATLAAIERTQPPQTFFQPPKPPADPAETNASASGAGAGAGTAWPIVVATEKNPLAAQLPGWGEKAQLWKARVAELGFNGISLFEAKGPGATIVFGSAPASTVSTQAGAAVLGGPSGPIPTESQCSPAVASAAYRNASAGSAPPVATFELQASPYVVNDVRPVAPPNPGMASPAGAANPARAPSQSAAATAQPSKPPASCCAIL